MKEGEKKRVQDLDELGLGLYFLIFGQLIIKNKNINESD